MVKLIEYALPVPPVRPLSSTTPPSPARAAGPCGVPASANKPPAVPPPENASQADARVVASEVDSEPALLERNELL
ncbi:hypothetical protein EVAR_82612_1 [Eumeta japonica]|uniref:Uncharacterized protein n=1 Tax=Eumeta variegata TaxID=151549 RepID=A0A4C1X6W0_EUMVA|nr:hypothetical protein EVAR_82612_1 [Eumeta japonica]